MVQEDFNTENGDEDGRIVNGHDCGFSVNNTANEMYTGSLTKICINDGMRDVCRSYMSFNTSSIPNDATITAASVFVYFVGRVKPKIFLWDAGYTQLLKANVRDDFIGDELDTGDYTMGGTNFYSSAAFKNWITAGWKEFDGLENYINVTGDTDIMLYPNDGWEDDCQNNAKHYYLRWNTVEKTFPNRKPYLRVTYTVKEKTFVTILGAS